MVPVPVTGLAANFSPIPRMAPPPLGRLNASSELPLAVAPAPSGRSQPTQAQPAHLWVRTACWLLAGHKRSTIPGHPYSSGTGECWPRTPLARVSRSPLTTWVFNSGAVQISRQRWKPACAIRFG